MNNVNHIPWNIIEKRFFIPKNDYVDETSVCFIARCVLIYRA